MRKRFPGRNTVGILILLLVSASAFMAQRPRNRPAAPAAKPQAASDLKLTYKMTTSGQSMEMTTMVKGARERSETRTGFGMDMINVTQCDLKRTIQISDKTRKYIITPMETVEATPASTPAPRPSAEPTRRGGVITYTLNTVDTGERKEMFGFQARHIKTSTTMASSADACTQIQQKIETDGWYIDFSAGFTCELGGSRPSTPPSASGGCQDRIEFKRTGAGRTGYPLVETTTAYGPNGAVTYSTTREVVELSREPLDAALFDVPAGYAETTNPQDLYGMPSMASMGQAAQSQPAENAGRTSAPATDAKAPGTIRVGVIEINNRSGKQVSTESLRQRLINDIEGNGIDAVPLNASSLTEAQAEASAKQCDFILFTDIGALKTSAAKKIGGLFGRAAGVGGIDKTEAKLEFKLYAVGETSPRLQSAATAKEEGDEASAGTAIAQEAKMVSAEVRKSRG
ncbi:MAG TPA: hypothetical protein VGW36_03815 [Pyrinomonadaceae bacterium]|nr:hypothetical protein [Pyrinomonadaceae bacterium]